MAQASGIIEIAHKLEAFFTITEDRNGLYLGIQNIPIGNLAMFGKILTMIQY